MSLDKIGASVTRGPKRQSDLRTLGAGTPRIIGSDDFLDRRRRFESGNRDRLLDHTDNDLKSLGYTTGALRVVGSGQVYEAPEVQIPNSARIVGSEEGLYQHQRHGQSNYAQLDHTDNDLHYMGNENHGDTRICKASS